VSMLLRRLNSTLKSSNASSIFKGQKMQFIITSATLGSEDNEIIDFASSLCCDSQFDPECIIRSERVNIKPVDKTIDFWQVLAIL